MKNISANTIKTTLVLLPGLDGTEVFFGPLLAHLPDSVETRVITYPGSGANDYDSLSKKIINKINDLDNFVMLGLSFGGPLALMLASHRPAQVRGVILCASFVTSPRPRLALFRFALRAPVIALTRAIHRLHLWMRGYATREFRHAEALAWKKAKAKVLASRARSALGVDARTVLRECRAPLMYMVCTQDEVISRASLNEIMAIAPHTQVAEIEGTHFAIFTNPVQSAACIVNFLQA